jgi:hypothetical protein
MKNVASYCLLGLLIGSLCDCSLTSREIAARSQSERTDVFREVVEDVPTSEGLVDLLIAASVKTSLPGYYFFESGHNQQGQPDYPFFINIDGQAVVWKIAGEKETTPAYTDQGKRNVEGGEGVRFALREILMLAPGPHRFIFGLPEEDFIMEISLTLNKNEGNILEFKPIYRANRGDKGRSYLNGINGGMIFLNGDRI